MDSFEAEQEAIKKRDINMELWNRVSKTNPAHTKKITFGRPITAIDPYRQIENATREFGPAGQGWGWEVKQVEHLPTNEVAVLIRVWVKDKDHAGNGFGYIEQWGQASLYTDNAEKKKDKDLMKKATTDGLTKCLSCMGFNADVFLGKFDDNKYVQDMEEAFKAKPDYTEASFNSELKAMTDLLATNPKATPDKLIARIEKNYTVSEDMKTNIRGIK